MSMRYKGGVISATPPTVTTSSAKGLWTMQDQMRYQAAGTWPPSAIPDPYFENVIGLFHFDGTNGAQNNTFLDSSTNNFTITRNGNTTQGSFSPFSRANGEWSNYFDGNGDYLSYASNAAFQFGTGDFTIEFWWNPSTLASTQAILYNTDNNSVIGTGHYVVVYNTSLGLRLYINGGATAINQGSTTGWTVGTWYHVAVVRNGNTATIYRDGVSIASGSVTGVTIGAATTSYFGGEPLDPIYSTGYFSNFRIVKGTAVYTAAFTPPTSPLTAIANTSLLTCQSNRFKDNSTNAFTLTVNGNTSIQVFNPFNPTTAYTAASNGGSGYFDGTGDYLVGPNNNVAFQMGTGDFTSESWVYLPSSPTGDNALWGDLLWSGGYQSGWYVKINSNRTVTVRQGGTSGTWDELTSSITITVGVWAHVAIARQSGTMRLFIDGVLAASKASTWNYTNASAFNVGAANVDGIGSLLLGYIASLRVVKGTALYTSAFTPPTAPLTAITNTSLLLNFTNAGAFDSAAIEDYETVGTSQLSTAQYKFGTSSLILNGTTSLYQNSLRGATFSPNFQMNNGPFTIEGFLRLTTSSATYPFAWTLIRGDNVYALGMFFGDAGYSYNMLIYYNNNLINVTNAAARQSAFLNTWKHFAFVRDSSSTFTVYVDGVSVYSTPSFTTDFNVPCRLAFGLYGDGSTFGYLDEFRITKGVARYTANFTPPTAAFPNL